MHLVLLQKDVLVGATLTVIVGVSATCAVVHALSNKPAQRVNKGSSVAMDRDSRFALFAPEDAGVRSPEVLMESTCRARYEGRGEAVSVDSLAYACAFTVAVDD